MIPEYVRARRTLVLWFMYAVCSMAFIDLTTGYYALCALLGASTGLSAIYAAGRFADAHDANIKAEHAELEHRRQIERETLRLLERERTR